MKKIFFFLAVAVAAIACKPEETITPEVNVLSDASALVIATEGGEVLIDFDANVDWTAEFKEAADWCSLSPKSGAAGDNKVKVIAIENATNENRSVTVVIKAQTATAEVVVEQLQKDALVAGATTLDVPAEGGELKVKLGSNVDFEVKTDADWLTYVPTKAYTETDLVFNAAANTALEGRTAKITITAGALKQEVTVNQAAFVPTFEMDATELWIASEGGSAELNITANFEYSVTVESDWLTVTNEGGKYTFTAVANPSFSYRAVEVVISGWTKEDVEETEDVNEAQKFYVFQNGRAEAAWTNFTNAAYGWTLGADKTRFAIVGDFILAANGTNVIKVLDRATGTFLMDYTLPEEMPINMLTTDDAGNIVAGYEAAYGGYSNLYYMTSLESQPALLGVVTNDCYSNFAGNLRVAGDVTKNASLVMYANLAQYYFAYNVVDGVMDETRTCAALPESDKTVWNCGNCVVYPLGDNLSKGLVYTGYTTTYDLYQTPDLGTWTSVASGLFNGNDNPNSMDMAVVNGKTYLAIGVGAHFSYTQARVVVLDVTDWANVTTVGTWNLPESSSSWIGVAGAWSDVAIVPTSGDSFDLYYFGANNEVMARIVVK